MLVSTRHQYRHRVQVEGVRVDASMLEDCCEILGLGSQRLLVDPCRGVATVIPLDLLS